MTRWNWESRGKAAGKFIKLQSWGSTGFNSGQIGARRKFPGLDKQRTTGWDKERKMKDWVGWRREHPGVLFFSFCWVHSCKRWCWGHCGSRGKCISGANMSPPATFFNHLSRIPRKCFAECVCVHSRCHIDKMTHIHIFPSEKTIDFLLLANELLNWNGHKFSV